jgi:hypothetical protein
MHNSSVLVSSLKKGTSTLFTYHTELTVIKEYGAYSYSTDSTLYTNIFAKERGLANNMDFQSPCGVCFVSLCNHEMKPGFICHKKKLWVKYTITTISKKPDMKVEPQNWIWCLKLMHHHYFVWTKFKDFYNSQNKQTLQRHQFLGTIDEVIM